MSDFAKYLKEELNKHPYGTGVKLANYLGVAPARIYEYTAGKHIPCHFTQTRIKKFFKGK